VLFLGEPLTVRQMGGAALVLAGVALTRVQPRKVVSVNV
jgi:drug/metabolite transporter (DMT)-like permease